MEPQLKIEDKIKIAERAYLEKNNKSPNYIGLSMYGYMELKRSVAVRLDQEDLEWESDMTTYEGMDVLVSQNIQFPDFVLL